MKIFKILPVIIFIIILTACKSTTDANKTPVLPTLPSKTYTDLHADTNSTKTAVFFSFKDSTFIPLSDTNTTKWDIGFYETSIFTNSGVHGPGMGGAIIQRNVIFADVAEAPASGYKTETSYYDQSIPTGAGNSWYNYDFSRHVILPIPGVTLIIRTGDGKYAKMRILNYYKGNPPLETLNEQSLMRYYTFEFVYQPNGTRQF